MNKFQTSSIKMGESKVDYKTASQQSTPDFTIDLNRQDIRRRWNLQQGIVDEKAEAKQRHLKTSVCLAHTYEKDKRDEQRTVPKSIARSSNLRRGVTNAIKPSEQAKINTERKAKLQSKSVGMSFGVDKAVWESDFQANQRRAQKAAEVSNAKTAKDFYIANKLFAQNSSVASLMKQNEDYT